MRVRNILLGAAALATLAISVAPAHADWRDDVAVIARVREAVGDRLEIMVDANQGWRMPGDRAPRWDVATAARVAATASASSTTCSRLSTRSPSTSMPTLHLTARSTLARS